MNFCGQPVRAQNELKIALSRCVGSKNYERYVEWIHQTDSNIRCVNLYGLKTDSAVKMLNFCDGLILTGGPDVFPGRYGKIRDTARCKTDVKRDTLEFALIERALEMNIPILGICRGLQILNVALGGSLIVDIPEDFGKTIVHRTGNDSCYHGVRLDTSSLLYGIIKAKQGTVNSSHHQAIHQPASSLRISAYAPDGIPEAIEWKTPDNHPWLLAVQWHPEKMEFSSIFSSGILKAFLEKARQYHNGKR